MLEGTSEPGPSQALLTFAESDVDLSGVRGPAFELRASAQAEPGRAKFAAGLRGLKHAIRGDSSFFAHGYRGNP